jgi:hypothetical protein
MLDDVDQVVSILHQVMHANNKLNALLVQVVTVPCNYVTIEVEAIAVRLYCSMLRS